MLFWGLQNTQAKEAGAKEVWRSQLPGRSDRANLISTMTKTLSSAPSPVTVTHTSSCSITERTMLVCPALQDLPLLAAKKKCRGFGLQLFIFSVWSPSFLLDADSDKEQCSWHLIGCCIVVKMFDHTHRSSREATASFLPYWTSSWRTWDYTTVFSKSCWQPLTEVQTSLPRMPPQAIMSLCWGSLRCKAENWWERAKSVLWKFWGFKIWLWLET